ncbi:MAG: hypothetical protein HXY34_12575 [Candidatus Thorarchaeota archaeon]|nr:hypothetical protein [Candidatus Thorarchaeota archaeon]
MRQVSDKGCATYTEIMQILGLDPSLMSGTFNYHLKELIDAGLIERTNGTYRITELGERALILVDHVSRDARIDKYGVLFAVLSMSPRKEYHLFMVQMGWITGLLWFIHSVEWSSLGHATGSIAFWLSIFSLVCSSALTVASIARMLAILRNYHLGLSVMVFLSSNWFFIRSPNRNRFGLVLVLTLGTYLMAATTVAATYAGSPGLLSSAWCLQACATASLATLLVALLAYAKKQADALEVSEIERE